MSKRHYQSEEYNYAIAVVGTAGKYCNAPTLEHLWSNLKNGYEAVRFLDKETLKSNGCPSAISEHPMFVPATAMMDDVDKFDADFFGFTTAEARLMDPQLRQMFQTAWNAFENANMVPDQIDGLTGVFAGAHKSDYLLCNLGPEYTIQVGMQALSASLFNGQDYLSTWLSYKLGLTGPSINVQTACSTGLTVIASACQSLLDFSCDTALAITGAIFSPRNWGYLAETGSILSADGHCRPFDASASGTITGEGVGGIILKRLQDALDDHDPIQGIIRGYAVNNDGAIRAGYTTPSSAGQEALITQALANAGLTSGDITYIEGHGTGTNLGDPVEFKALQSIFSRDERKAPCYLGSIKANLGHLGASAGMVGLQKILLMLREGTITPQINYTTPNPEMGLDETIFQISTEVRDWPKDSPKIAGISSFGLGGTNCHMIVEGVDKAALDASYEEQNTSPLPLCITARSEKALGELCKTWADFLLSNDQVDFEGAKATALSGRAALPWRVAVTGTTKSEVAEKLLSEPQATLVSADLQNRTVALVIRELVFSDFLLGEKLLATSVPFKQAFDDCARLIQNMHGDDLYGLLDQYIRTPADQKNANKMLQFAIMFSLSQLIAAAGIRPALVADAEVSGLVAKVLTGALSLSDALCQLCTPRCLLVQELSVPAEKWAIEGSKLLEGAEEESLHRCVQENNILLCMGNPTPPSYLSLGTKNTASPAWIAISSLPDADGAAFHEKPEDNLTSALGALFLAGATFSPNQGFRLQQIPQYQFEQNSYWPDKSTSFCDMLSPSCEQSACACHQNKAEAQTTAPDNSDNDSNEFSIEQCMRDIWNNALGTTDIGQEDDFFAKGGTSLSAIAIVSDIKKYTGLTIQLRELLQLKTINGVISRLAELAEEDAV